ncbi:MAG: hypothetical protein R3Y64_07870 [Peptostreptococcaceae bacterium]
MKLLRNILTIFNKNEKVKAFKSIDVQNDNKLCINIIDIFNNKNGIKANFSDDIFDITEELIINDSKIEYTRRFLNNGDILVFLEVDTKQKIIIELNDSVNLDYSDFENMYKIPPFDNRYGENKVTGPSLYGHNSNLNIIVSKVYHYRKLQHKYDDGENSELYELKAETNNIEKLDKGINIAIDNVSEKASLFFMISKEKLFLNKDSMDNYFKFYYKSIENNFVANSYFIQKSGTYTKLPYSIEPFTKDGYGYSLHHSSKKELIDFLIKDNERYFYNMLTNAIVQAFMYQKHENGVFYTSYTSTWLKKDTGIKAPYIDTRLNETFNLMIKDYKKIIDNKNIIDNTINYMNYIINYEKNGGEIYISKRGKFYPDYFKYGLKGKTHTSLNHQLGIANSMLEIYYQTNENKYLDSFLDIMYFLEDTCDSWIKSNGDLFYGLRIQDRKDYFYGDDYVYVTLIDLLISQKNWKNINGDFNIFLNKLINSKLSYLDSNEYGIFNDNSKYASGEPIQSKNQAVRLYKEIFEY